MADGWKWYWASHPEPEVWEGCCETREQAIAEAYSTDDSIAICEGRPETLNDNFFEADRVLEEWHEANEDRQDEDGGLRMDPSHAQKMELEETLNEAFAAWRAKHGLGRAWTLETRNEEVVQLNGNPSDAD